MADRPKLERITTVEEQQRTLAGWIRAKVRWAERLESRTISIPLGCATRIAGLLDYAAEAEEKR